MSRNNNYLFNEGDLSDFLRQREDAMRSEIGKLASDYVLKASLDDLVAHFTSEFSLEPLVLVRENIQIGDHGDTSVDMSHDPRYGARQGVPCLVPATFATYVVPFNGDAVFFRLRPSTFNTMPPSGKIVGQQLHLRYISLEHKGAEMRASFDRDLNNVEQYLSWSGGTINGFNQSVGQKIRQQLESRKEKFLKDQGLVESLGFPIKPRTGAAQSYAAPVSRKKLPIQKPAVASGAFKPEPSLALEEYDHILTIVANMVLVMERSPMAFAKMVEEDLRTHILVQLNGHYEGQASGETFNGDGKTDILIRTDGRNIFIGECKFWKGAASFTGTIDQLLGYTAWRDTKTAIILFNRNKDTSAVIAQIPGLVKQHPNFKRDTPSFRHESGFRFVLHHRDDKNRELVLTVLVFDVPT